MGNSCSIENIKEPISPENRGPNFHTITRSSSSRLATTATYNSRNNSSSPRAGEDSKPRVGITFIQNLLGIGNFFRVDSFTSSKPTRERARSLALSRINLDLIPGISNEPGIRNNLPRAASPKPRVTIGKWLNLPPSPFTDSKSSLERDFSQVQNIFVKSGFMKINDPKHLSRPAVGKEYSRSSNEWMDIKTPRNYVPYVLGRQDQINPTRLNLLGHPNTTIAADTVRQSILSVPTSVITSPPRPSNNPTNVSQNFPEPLIIFIFGGPGSFKSDIILNMVDMFGYTYLSANDILLYNIMSGIDVQMLASELKEYAENSPDTFSLSNVLYHVKRIITQNLNDHNLSGGIAKNGVSKNLGYLIDIMPCSKFLPSGSDYFVDPSQDLREFEKTFPIKYAISLNIAENKLAQFVAGSAFMKKPRFSLHARKGPASKLFKSSSMPRGGSTESLNMLLESNSQTTSTDPRLEDDRLSISSFASLFAEEQLSTETEKPNPNAPPSFEDKKQESASEQMAKEQDAQENLRLKRRIFRYQQNSEDFLQYFWTTDRLVSFDISSNDLFTIWLKIRRFLLTFHQYYAIKDAENAGKPDEINFDQYIDWTKNIELKTKRNTQTTYLVFLFKQWSLNPTACRRLHIKQIRLQVICKTKRLESPEQNVIDLLRYIDENSYNAQELFIVDCSKTSLMNLSSFILQPRSRIKANKTKISPIADARHKSLLLLDYSQTPIRLNELIHIYLHGLSGDGRKAYIANLITVYKNQFNLKLISLKASHNIECYFEQDTHPLTYKWVSGTIKKLRNS